MIWERWRSRSHSCQSIPSPPLSRAYPIALPHAVRPSKPAVEYPTIPSERFYAPPRRPVKPSPPLEPAPEATSHKDGDNPPEPRPHKPQPVMTREQRETISSCSINISRAISRHLNSRSAAKHTSMMFATVKVPNITQFSARCVCSNTQ